MLPKTFQRGQVDIPADLEALYANHVLVRFSPTAFALDFVHVLPGRPVQKVRLRVLMSPYDAGLLGAALCGDEADAAERSRSTRQDSGHQRPGPALPRLPLLPPPARERGQQDKFGRGYRPEVVVPADLRTVRSNLSVITASDIETILDFAHLAPNAFRAQVTARVVMAAGAVPMLAQAIKLGLEALESKYGPICPPDEDRQAPHLRSTAVWGLSIPFSAS